MQIVLLSGGNGKRLWPLSSEKRSKQFLKLLKDPDGAYESMVQRVYRQIRASGITASVTIATNLSQKDIIVDQLGDSVDLILEPERRDTFPAIALAAAYLSSEKGCAPDEVVVVLPVDPYTENAYFQTISEMEKTIQNSACDLVLMGITPTYPSEKYGYIVPKQGQIAPPYEVDSFIEKPPETKAIELIEHGAVWNGGVFAFRLGYLLKIAEQYIEPVNYQNFYTRYSELPKISFDYKVVEKAESVVMLPFSGEWKDLGTWNTLTDTLSEQTIGNVITGEGTENTHIINELEIPVVALGIKNVVISVSADGVLVCDKSVSAKMKEYVEGL